MFAIWKGLLSPLIGGQRNCGEELPKSATRTKDSAALISCIVLMERTCHTPKLRWRQCSGRATLLLIRKRSSNNLTVCDRRRGLRDEREQRLIDGALQSTERAGKLVQRLLAFARRQPLQLHAINVGDLLIGITDLVTSMLGPQIKLMIDVAPNLPLANADSNQLEMASA
jgi:signal transduction histidine kinase